ncbi:MAG: zinc-ribbon domain containing protein [bacterium]
MPSQTKTCRNCQRSFVIEPEDLEFYQKMQVPSPERCPKCRAERRLAFRNERFFYNDKCKKCGKAIISQFSPESKLIVYCHDCYWKDDWSGQDFGREFNFEKTLGEQLRELHRIVPHLAVIHTDSENSEYTHLAANNKDCYMLIESSNNERCLHSYWLQRCKDSVDSCYSNDSELLYESDDLRDCYRVFYSRSSENCTDGYFLQSCRNCSDCFGCVNMSNKNFCVFNEQKTENEYRDFITNRRLDTYSGVQKARQDFHAFRLKHPARFAEIYKAENSTGNYIYNATNCRQAFHTFESENCKYVEHAMRDARDCMDASTVGIQAELVYDSLNCALGVYRLRFCNQCWSSSSDLDYCFYCGGLNSGFGCVGIKKGEFCILNKVYSQEEFAKLQSKIIDHLKKTGEWGSFLPPENSLFGYNETAAQDIYPLSKDESLQTGFGWRENTGGTFGKETIGQGALPESIHEVGENIVKEIFGCLECGRNYKIIANELAFYKQQGIPLPRECPDCRHRRRVSARGPNELFKRVCMCKDDNHGHGGACQNHFETNIPTSDSRIVYCEECYREEIG